MEFAEGLTELMDAAARGEAGPELLSRCCGPGLRARRVKRGERILHAGFPIRSVRIMLSGRCHVLTISRDGRSFIAYVNEGFQIYGLTELLCGGEAFSASITAEEDCLFAEADARRFCALLENSGGFSGVVLRYLASLVERAMQTSVRRRFAGGYEAVLLYLHERVRQETPARYPSGSTGASSPSCGVEPAHPLPLFRPAGGGGLRRTGARQAGAGRACAREAGSGGPGDL